MAKLLKEHHAQTMLNTRIDGWVFSRPDSRLSGSPVTDRFIVI